MCGSGQGCMSQIALYVLMFDMVWHRFCPQALAEALKVNQTLTNVNLECNNIGKEGAKAWCLGRGSAWLQASKRWTNMESSGVPVVFETCEILVVLDRCSGVGALDFSKSLWNGMEGRCKWDGGKSSETCNLLAREISNQVNAHYIYTRLYKYGAMFFKRFILTSWSRLQCVVVDKAILSQIALYVLMFDMVWHCFCPQALAEALKVNQTLTNVNLERNEIDEEGAKAWCLGRGSAWLQASKRWTKMESSGVPVVFETCETLVVLVDWCSGVRPVDLSKSLWNGMEGRCKWDGGESSETCN